MAEVVISAKRCWTRPTAIRQTTWEMLSRNVREAYLWQVLLVEGGRDEVSVLGCRQMSMVVINAIVNPVDTREASGHWWLGIRQPESPAN